jgi:hypothetical protein
MTYIMNWNYLKTGHYHQVVFITRTPNPSEGTILWKTEVNNRLKTRRIFYFKHGKVGKIENQTMVSRFIFF